MKALKKIGAVMVLVAFAMLSLNCGGGKASAGDLETCKTAAKDVAKKAAGPAADQIPEDALEQAATGSCAACTDQGTAEACKLAIDTLKAQLQ